ncbi:alanine racemase [Helicobacter turcicus]|uniref:Alanine racemase n=1 Tax=Helicobacter turcicus TaxID=2867412 RepID=A0ABS7JML6_9HELI|nr:alanine racemase [Helicobacter turcicus]MBX7490644.1 alanine racemase [Helicobacter turcicus]MBX7545448.1 alanine racemase [Helicobacter turcicus]
MPYLEISKNNFFYNHKIITKAITPKNSEKIAIVLKDNAYGHGITEVATLAKEVGIQTAFVKNIQEALSIAPLFKNITILYPNSLPNQSALKSALNIPHIAFCVPSLESLQDYPANTSIELKIDSGMHRNGITKEQLHEALTIIQAHNLRLKGIFTHNGYGDDLSSAFYAQNIEFLEIKKEALKLCAHFKIPRPRFHSLSSSGAMRASAFNATLPQELQDDLFRIGIAFYGYNSGSLEIPKLKPIASLFANKISTLKLEKGASIGYSGVSTLKTNGSISTYDIGYGDGLFRLREGMELYTAEGYRILPRASMDCISVESDTPKVCVFNDVRAFANAFKTIPYEILTHLHAYIPRIIV